MVKVTKEILENKKVKLEIHIDPQTFEKGMMKSYLKNRKSISVPGFRKGKVPRKVIERYYGEAVFYEDAINVIFPEAYDDAVKETGIEPVAMPEIDIAQIGSGKELILTAEVVVKPEVELGQYKGIEVEDANHTVSDEEVEEALKKALDDNARWIDVIDRGAENGDRATLDFDGSVDGREFPGGSAEKQSLDIGSGQFIPGFEEQLIGMKPEEEKDITVTFPEDYQAEDLKGKEAVFHVKIHDIKKKELPERNDDFAKDTSEFSTLAEYQADLRKKLQKTADENARTTMENQLIQEIADHAKVDIPEKMVDNEIDNMVRDMEYRMQYSGVNLQQYLEATHTSVEDFRAQYKETAYNRVKIRLVMEAVTRAEGIVATDGDLEKKYAELAEQYKMDTKEVKKNFGSNEEYLKGSVLSQKTTDMLMKEAVVVKGKKNPKDGAEEEDHRSSPEASVEEDASNAGKESAGGK